MAQNGRNAAHKRKYNKRTYVQHLFRVRAESELASRLKTHIAFGETSLNFLITSALCNYFGVELPHKYYDVTRRTQIYPPTHGKEPCK